MQRSTFIGGAAAMFAFGYLHALAFSGKDAHPFWFGLAVFVAVALCVMSSEEEAG